MTATDWNLVSTPNGRPDAAGYWFLAAVLFAFIAAGIIVYRAGNTEMQTAANYRQTAQSDPVISPTIVPR